MSSAQVSSRGQQKVCYFLSSLGISSNSHPLIILQLDAFRELTSALTFKNFSSEKEDGRRKVRSQEVSNSKRSVQAIGFGEKLYGQNVTFRAEKENLGISLMTIERQTRNKFKCLNNERPSRVWSSNYAVSSLLVHPTPSHALTSDTPIFRFLFSASGGTTDVILSRNEPFPPYQDRSFRLEDRIEAARANTRHPLSHSPSHRRAWLKFAFSLSSHKNIRSSAAPATLET